MKEIAMKQFPVSKIKVGRYHKTRLYGSTVALLVRLHCGYFYTIGRVYNALSFI
jgi:hypothetical protein